MIEPIKQAIRSGMRAFARILDKVSGGRVTPNGVTIFGVAMHIPIALLIAYGHNIWGGILLFIFGLFDTLDGELARMQGRASAQGRLLDSVTDRMKETLLYSGVAYAIIARGGHQYLAAWAVAACGCSLLTSYVNAAGDSIMAGREAVKEHASNKAFRGGLLPFEIRMFILFVGLLCNQIPIAVIIITIGAAITALGRLHRVMQRISETDA